MRLRMLVAVVAILLVVGTASATVKWQQLPDPAGHEWIAQQDLCKPYSGECADDFECLDGEPIRAVEWWGTTGWGTILPDHYIIRFYSDVPDPDPLDPGTWSYPGDLLYEEECWDFTAEWDEGLQQFHFYQDLTEIFCQLEGTVYWFSVTGVTCFDTSVGAFWCDCLETNWWNDAAVYRSVDFGWPEWTSMEVYAPSYGRTNLAFVLHTGPPPAPNIVCVPDPLDITVGSNPGTIDVDYLGGGCGLIFGYSMTVTWDDALATLTGITEGGLLSSGGATNFYYYKTGDTWTIDCALLGAAGVNSPGTLFTLAFTGTSSGTGALDVGIVAIRDNLNNSLGGYLEDDGLINSDVTSPVFTDVSVFNLTLAGHTDEYAKNSDDLQLTAAVTDDHPLVKDDIKANLSTLLSGGGSAVTPDTYGSGVATWTIPLAGVSLTADGLKTVMVTATDWLGNSGTGSDNITADNTLPGTITGFDAAPAHEEVVLLWDIATGLDTNYCGVMVRYDVWDDYPLYDLPDPAPYPGVYTAGTEVFNGDATGTTHGIIPRDIHYYSAFVYDCALNYGTVTTAGQDRATNYWLGDVANTGNNWVPDGLVTVHDINKLSTLYGGPPADEELECDVGPTDDYSRVGIPLPDDLLNFEDLMIFAMNYGVVAPRIVPFLVEPGIGELALALSEVNRSSDGVLTLALRLEGNLGEVKGLSAKLEFEGLEFLSARPSDEMSAPVADVFFWSDATSRSAQVDVAVLGTDVTIGGSGSVALLTFHVLDEAYTVDFASAALRGAGNDDLTAVLEGLSVDDVPAAFKLVQNTPNPFNPVTTVGYHVPNESRVTISVYDVTGRLVATLVDGVVEPGRHSVAWNGTNERGEPIGSGVYFCTMEAPDYTSRQKMILLK